MRISELIKRLEKAKAEHGDLPMYYATDYDSVLPIEYDGVGSPDSPNNWDGEPNEKYVYLN